jgi:hypothetical protein
MEKSNIRLGKSAEEQDLISRRVFATSRPYLVELHRLQLEGQRDLKLSSDFAPTFRYPSQEVAGVRAPADREW